MFSVCQPLDQRQKHSQGADMKYLVDAQLPYLLADILRQKGYDTIHTDDLPDKDETSDTVIRQVAARADRVVITKDSDFRDSHLLLKQPVRLLLLTTGNIKNRKLLDLYSGKRLER